jgi:predicted ATPase
MSRIWPDTHVEEANLRVQVSTLRRALGGDGSGEAYVANAPGRGYRFIAQVERRTRNGALIERQSRWMNLSEPIGREREIAAITSRIGDARLLTIVGPGGVGKTTLAFACARVLATRFADGVAISEVSGGADPAVGVATSLGLRLADDGILAALSAYVAPLELLVVLDSCEFAIDASARLAESILREAPNVVVLATSREPLLAESEAVWRIDPLATPPYDQRLDAAAAIAYPAVRLFSERASAADRGFRFTEETASVVCNICRRLDGLPLAIELAAGRVSAFGLEAIEAGLDNRFQMLNQGRRTATPRQRTLAATVDWSYDALSGQEQRALRCFGLFQGAFDAEAAAWVALGEGAAPASVYGTLSDLVAKSLVVAETSSTQADYRLLDTTRAYARQKLEAAGELSQAAARHAAWIIGIMSSASSQLDTRSLPDWRDFFDRKLEESRAALDWAYSPDGDPSLILPLTIATIPLWSRFTRHEECRRRLEAALPLARPGSREDLELSGALASVLSLSLDGATAEAHCLRTISMAKQLQDVEAQLRSEFALWSIHINSARVSAALADLATFLEHAGQAGGRWEGVVGDRMASLTHFLAGDLPAARAAIERYLPKGPTRDARKRLAWRAYDPDIRTRNTLANLLWVEGAPDSAMAAVNANLARALAIGDDDLTIIVLPHVCLLARYVGDTAAVERHIPHLEMLVMRTTSPLFTHWAAILRACLAAERGDVAPGLALIDAGVPAGAIHPRFAPVLVELALSLGNAGAVDPARRLADQLLQRVQANGELCLWSEVQRVRGELCEDEAQALDLFAQAIATARTQGAVAWGLRAATSLAQRRPRQAREVLAPWLDSLKEGGRTRDVSAARAILRRADA